MIIKDKFTLLKNVPNIMKYTEEQLKHYLILDGPSKIYSTIKLIENRIDHFTKKLVIKYLDDIEKNKQSILVVKFNKYILPVVYNKTDKNIIINLNSFGTDDISRVDPHNIYACLVYGICFKELVSGKINLSENTAGPFISFLLTVFMKLFGKEFGLLGIYATQIPKLKFLIACYILSSLYGLKSNDNLYKKSSYVSAVDYNSYKDRLNQFNFSNIEDFIKSLSVLNVMPGLNKHIFAIKFVKILSVQFLPLLEDLSRYVSIIVTSNLPGTNIIPTFIKKYNPSEYQKILDISKKVFK